MLAYTLFAMYWVMSDSGVNFFSEPGMGECTACSCSNVLQVNLQHGPLFENIIEKIQFH